MHRHRKTAKTLYAQMVYEAKPSGSDLSGALLWQYAHAYVTIRHSCLMPIQHALFLSDWGGSDSQ